MTAQRTLKSGESTMKNPTLSIRSNQEGSTLVTAVVMLAVASVTIGSILAATMNYSRHTQATHRREKAAFLAEAGLRAALVKLNAYSDANISYSQSHSYFSQTNSFKATNWGFRTQVAVTNGRNMLISNGRYQLEDVDLQAEVSLGAGSRSIHALYAHAMFVGNADSDTNYVLMIGGTGGGADFVNGDTYSGNDIELTGDSLLRLPEALLNDVNGDGDYELGTDAWQNAYATQVFANPLLQDEFDVYEASIQPDINNVYENGKYDEGEAFVDTIGNGVYDLGEPYTDSNENGVHDAGDEFIDRNGNGSYDAGIDTVVDNGNGQYDLGEEWTEDSDSGHHRKRLNGRYDPPGGFWKWKKNNNEWVWKTRYKKRGVWYYCADWSAEAFEDVGDGSYDPAEPYTDQNGIYDEGEQYVDDRNSVYDYGTQAPGNITGMPASGPGQRAAVGGDAPIESPDLMRMYYDVNRNDLEPGDALARWGNDVAITASDYNGNIAINNDARPEHIFLRNPPNSSSSSYVMSDGARIYRRTYTPVYDNDGTRVDDYFLEDPTDPTFNTIPAGYDIAQNDNARTHTTLVNVKPEDNAKLYYVEGNLYIHSPTTYSMRFREPGTRITIVAKGNITISDEFYYNAEYSPNLQYSDMDSTVVNNASDAFCLIALKNTNCTSDSGNIYIGDRQFGTGGSVHAMLYAEKDFVDNNINSTDQQFISVFGNMTAGNQMRLNRQVGGGYYRTRLDVTLDSRIRDGEMIVPGLPHALGTQRSIQLDTAWHMVPGSWSSWSMLK